MKSLLGIGECMIELSLTENKLWKQGFAGDVFNTLWYAKALSKQDVIVNFYTATGDDKSSNEMLEFITGAGIICQDIPIITNGVPGLYKIHLDGAERSFSYWRDTSAAKLMMSNPELLWKQVSQADIVYLSGITLAILPKEDVNTLLQELRSSLKKSAIVAFDPNIRPALWDSESRMKEIISSAGAISDLVLPSFDDEKNTFGDQSPLETAKRYHSLGADQIIVKNSDQDTLYSNKSVTKYYPVNKVSGIVDTTAAGDSFNGAYLAELLNSGDCSKAIELAHLCSSTVICNKGALIPFETVQASVI